MSFLNILLAIFVVKNMFHAMKETTNLEGSFLLFNERKKKYKNTKLTFSKTVQFRTFPVDRKITTALLKQFCTIFLFLLHWICPVYQTGGRAGLGINWKKGQTILPYGLRLLIVDSDIVGGLSFPVDISRTDSARYPRGKVRTRHPCPKETDVQSLCFFPPRPLLSVTHFRFSSCVCSPSS